MRRAICFIICSIAVVWGSDGAAQQQEADNAPERLAVVTTDECGGTQAGADLRDALRARLPETELVSGAEVDSGVRLYWRPGQQGRCRLELEGTDYDGDGTPAIALEPTAGKTAVRNAASRIVWLLTAREAPPPGERGETGEEETGEESAQEQEEGAGSESPSEEQKEAEPASDESTEDSGAEEDASDESEEASKNEGDRADEASNEAGGQSDEEPSFTGGTVVPFRATLVPLVSVPSGAPEDPVPVYAFNFVGNNFGLRGFEFGVLFNTEESYADGFQIAGLGNWISGPMRGFQTGGLLNVNAGTLRGVSASGFANVAGDVRGVQFSGGVGNLALGEMRGMQSSPGLNLATGDVTGLQVGLANVATDVAGFQAGLVNVGAEVDGAQAGMVNIAAESAASIGVVNINSDRPAYVHAWTNEMLVFSAGLQHGSRYFQNILRFGYRPLASSRFLSPGIGFAGHFPFEIPGGLSGYIDVDAMYNLAVPTEPLGATPAHWGQARLTGGLRFGRRIALYSGLSFNVARSIDPSESVQFVRDAIPFSGPSDEGGIAWPGFFGGVRF